MTLATYLPTHPILFVFDYENKEVAIPTYDPDSVASATPTCISVRTIADVDGSLTVSLTESMPPGAFGVEVFKGRVATPSRSISVVTAQDEVLVRQLISQEEAAVTIVVDDTQHPSRIWIEAH